MLHMCQIEASIELATTPYIIQEYNVAYTVGWGESASRIGNSIASSAKTDIVAPMIPRDIYTY